MRNRVAVIGGGAAGLSAAYHLRDVADVTLFERDGRFGGHANTIEVTEPDGNTIGVDTAFVVFDEGTYPRLMRSFADLDVKINDRTGGFNFFDTDTGIPFWSIPPELIWQMPASTLIACLLSHDEGGLGVRKVDWKTVDGGISYRCSPRSAATSARPRGARWSQPSRRCYAEWPFSAYTNWRARGAGPATAAGCRARRPWRSAARRRARWPAARRCAARCGRRAPASRPRRRRPPRSARRRRPR